MKMWRLCFLLLTSAGMAIALATSGCGDNPCDDSPCARIQYAVPDRCLVIEEEDFACACCTADDGIPCEEVTGNPADEGLETQWDENTKTCVEAD